MNLIVFLLLSIICIGLIYVVHKYFGKEELYFLTIIYTIISFLLSFKIINLFGLDINMGIIFSSGLLVILYYFVNRYSAKETRNLFLLQSGSLVTLEALFLLTSLLNPSLNDSISMVYKDMLVVGAPIFIMYPISFVLTYYLSSYCFEELKKDNKNKILKTILTSLGITFISVFVFIYFSYAVIYDFSSSLMLTVGNYFIEALIIVIYILCINKILSIKKVK